MEGDDGLPEDGGCNHRRGDSDGSYEDGGCGVIIGWWCGHDSGY